VEYIPGQALVLLRSDTKEVSAKRLATAEGTSFIARVAKSAGAGVTKTWGALSEARGEIFTLMTSDSQTTEELMAALKADPRVVSVSPNFRVRAAVEPNDPYYVKGDQWNMKRIRADEAWSVTTGSNSVYVAVMDTGIYAEHEDLAGNVAVDLARSYVKGEATVDPDGHGTHVGGTIGAVGNNETGVAGVNWSVKIIPLKILGNDGNGDLEVIFDALDYLVELLRQHPDMQIPAVNLSLGGWAAYSPKEMEATPYWTAFRTLDALNRTMIVVAAGNEGLEVGQPAPHDDLQKNYSQGDYIYPASFTGLDNMIVVGAIDETGNAAGFSNWSETAVHLAAPGMNVISTASPQADYTADGEPDGLYYARMSGTSMATPHVAGAAALLSAKNRNFTASQLKSALLQGANGSANPVVPARGRNLSAYGLLDVRAALDNPADAENPAPVPATGIAIAPNGVVSLQVGLTATLSAVLTPRNASDQSVLWSSNNEAVVTVDQAGRIRAHSAGYAKITARAMGAAAGTEVVDSVFVDVTDPDEVPSNSNPGGGGGCNGGLVAFLPALLFFALALRRGTE
jgi:subtilisin family serine protease